MALSLALSVAIVPAAGAGVVRPVGCAPTAAQASAGRSVGAVLVVIVEEARPRDERDPLGRRRVEQVLDVAE